MSTNVLGSAGVLINEVDLSPVARNPSGTNIFITGFASQGPTDEVVDIGSPSEYEAVFGTPTNEAERYLYHTAKSILTQSPANLMVTRMAYGSGSGSGFANSYSALVFPVSAAIETITPHYSGNGVTFNSTVTSSTTSYVNANYTDANYFKILAPRSILLSEEQYLDVTSNNLTWSSGYSGSNINSANDLAYGGIVVVDTAKVAVNSLFEGYYIALADNSNNNPASNFDSITGVKAAHTIVSNSYQTFVDIPETRLNFRLTQDYNTPGSSLSQIIEQNPTGYDFAANFYNDCLTMMVFKIRTSIYAQDTVTLDYKPINGFTGSLYTNKFQNNSLGGAPITFSLDKVSNLKSQDVKVIINPFISSTGNWTDADGTPLKKVRVDGAAKNLYSQGIYVSDTNASGKDLGNVPQKLERILNRLEDLDIDLDIFPEAGLGTIWTGACAKKAATILLTGVTPASDAGYYFDELFPVSNALLAELKQQTNNPDSTLKLNYGSIIQQLYTFAEKTRKDHVFIPDPLRYIFVNGPDTKVSKRTDFVFSTDVYWPLKNLYGDIVSSYGAVYGNWVKTNDTTSNQQVWLPISGWVAADIAYSSAISFPWAAPAGFNRGVLTGINDLAINPTQKHRDLLQRINVNPVTYFKGDGYVVYGQKTMFNKPSAFDRLNVRRLFLILEKATKGLCKYFVFENNTYAVRARLVNALDPIFRSAKTNDGCYDYKIVCDERNNTPDVIDSNELKVAIYIQPVRAGEKILVDFIGTRTGVDFNELTANTK